MPLESATFISQLVATNPVGASDPKGQGDDHIRLLKSVLQATFPNISGAVTPTHAQLNALISVTAPTNKISLDANSAGTANTFIRTDAKIQLDQAITPTWTGPHSFSFAGAGTNPSVDLASTRPVLRWRETDQAADEQYWIAQANDKAWSLYSANAIGASKFVLNVTRGVGNAVTDLSFGNAEDNPTFSFLGTGAGTSANPWTWSGTHIFNATNSNMVFQNTNAVANAKNWVARTTNAGDFALSSSSDSSPGTAIQNVLIAARTGLTITNISLGNAVDNPTYSFLGTGAMTVGGIEVGYRGLPQRVVTSSTSTVAADAGKCIIYAGTGGHTITLAADSVPVEGIVTIMNFGSAAITIAETLSSDLNWLNGSGSYSTGSRTLAAAGVCSIFMQSTGTAFIWGTGLS